MLPPSAVFLVRGPGWLAGPDGNLYGVTPVGGTEGMGTIFKITLGGTLTTLHSFEGVDGSAHEA
jgi:uncharacterized repeat protein (TIGR03803 family)